MKVRIGRQSCKAGPCARSSYWNIDITSDIQLIDHHVSCIKVCRLCIAARARFLHSSLVSGKNTARY